MQTNEISSTHKHHAAIQPLLYDKRSAAALLSLSVRTIDNLIARKELKRLRIGGRVMIPAHELNRFVMQDHPLRRVAA